MFKKFTVHLAHILLVVALLLGLLGLGQAVLAGNIDPTNKWAWSTNAGWINFNAGNNGQVTVYADRLEGDAYGENIGWIRLKGTAQDNTAYGVSNDGCGNLSGYAWGTNVGWINFDPSNDEQVTVDPVTGHFDGYAYGENIGYIRFQGTSPAYKTQAEPAADPMGSLADGYQNNIAAIVTSRLPGPATSSGLSMADSGFLQDRGDCIIFGHNPLSGATKVDMPSSGDWASAPAPARWLRAWDFTVHDGAGTTGGTVDITFDFSVTDVSPAGPAANYRLLKRNGDTGPFSDITAASGATASYDGTSVTISGVDVTQLGSNFTLGTVDNTSSPTASNPLAVSLSYFLAETNGGAVDFTWQTASEQGVAGFNLYADGATTPLNDELIPSPVIDSVTPTAYRHTAQTPATVFYLDEVGIDGANQRHGPFNLGEVYGVTAANPDGENERQSIFLPVVVQ